MEKAIWITGASSGIGRQAVKLFLNEGFTVIASARSEDKLNNLADEAKELCGKMEIIICDVAIPDQIKSAYEEISKKFDVECLINNAGITSFKPFELNTDEEIEGIIDTNLYGSIYTAKAVLGGMIKQGGGTIINILSVITEKVFKNSSIYSASKSGLLAFSNVLREEVRRHNIRVICITPGATETEIWSEEMRDKFAHRMMTPKEIAELILFAYKQQGSVVIENITARPILGDL